MIGNIIRQRREELGMSQMQLAIKTGYTSRSSINKIEQGINDIPRKKLALFANALKININTLYETKISNNTILTIKEYIDYNNISYDKLSKMSGIPLRTIEDIFSGKTKNPRIDTLEAIELALNIVNNADNKYMIKNEIELNDNNAIPLLGRVVAGIPLEAQENLEGYVYVSYKPKEEYFALRVYGESMINAGIPDKSILIVHKQEIVNSGEIVVAMINGEQTVKRFKEYSGKYYLMPENNNFAPIPITENDEFLILGKVVEVRVSFL